MKLFEVTNGYMGESYVRILIIANNEIEAMKTAINEYHKAKKNYTHLECFELCNNTSKKWCSDVTDG